MLDFFRPLISPELSIIEILPRADRVVLVARPTASETSCPCCGSRTSVSIAITSVGWRICLGMGVLWRFSSRPAVGDALIRNVRARSSRKRLPETVLPKARRMTRYASIILPSAFAAGGEPGSRLSRKLGMPVSGDTLLRMVRVAACEPISAPRVVGVDDWAWRKGQRYGTIICDLERNRVLDCCRIGMPTRSQSWLGATRASR